MMKWIQKFFVQDKNRLPPEITQGVLVAGGMNSGLNNMLFWYIDHYAKQELNMHLYFSFLYEDTLLEIAAYVKNRGYSIIDNDAEISTAKNFYLHHISEKSKSEIFLSHEINLCWNIIRNVSVHDMKSENNIFFESQVHDADKFSNVLYLRNEFDSLRGLMPGEAIYNGRKYYFPLIDRM